MTGFLEIIGWVAVFYVSLFCLWCLLCIRSDRRDVETPSPPRPGSGGSPSRSVWILPPDRKPYDWSDDE